MSLLRARNYGQVTYFFGKALQAPTNDGGQYALGGNDSIDVGTGDFSVRFWRNPILTGTESSVRVLSIDTNSGAAGAGLEVFETASGTSNNGVSNRGLFFRLTADSSSYVGNVNANTLNTNIRLISPGRNYTGFDIITHDVLNWVHVVNQYRSGFTSFTSNTLKDRPTPFSFDFKTLNLFKSYAHLGTGAGIIDEFQLYTPALSEAQSNFLYNTVYNIDPRSSESKAMGIGVYGIDTIGVNGITVLLRRYMKFNDIYTSGTDRYLREEVSNNNIYARCIGYTAGQELINF